jgi:hypothetical protein
MKMKKVAPPKMACKKKRIVKSANKKERSRSVSSSSESSS